MELTRRVASGPRSTGRLATAALALAGLVAALLGGLPAPASAAGSHTGDLLAAVNSARASNGRAALSLQSDLSSVAARWAAHLAATGRLQHNPNLSSEVHDWRWLGENVGYGPSWSDVESAFMHSAPHRANILDADYTQIGIGVAEKGGRVWVTQVFRRPASDSSRSTHRTHHNKPPATRPAARTRAPSAAGSTQAGTTARPRPGAGAGAARARLAHRVSTATAQAPPTGDVLQRALGFAAAMRTVSS